MMLDMLNEDSDTKVKTTSIRKQDEYFKQTFEKKKNVKKSEIKMMEDKLKEVLGHKQARKILKARDSDAKDSK